MICIELQMLSHPGEPSRGGYSRGHDGNPRSWLATFSTRYYNGDKDRRGRLRVREWQYWTRNKLEILAGYLPAFDTAAKDRSSERSTSI